MRGLSLVVASGGHSSSRCADLSPSWSLLLRSTGSRCAGSAIVAHGPSCSAACGIFPDQGSNPCPLHWQADSQPLRHQGSPQGLFNSSSSGKSFPAWRRVGESPCESSESHHWDVEGHWKDWFGDWRLLDHLVYSSLFFSVLTSYSNNRLGGFCLQASICWS